MHVLFLLNNHIWFKAKSNLIKDKSNFWLAELEQRWLPVVVLDDVPHSPDSSQVFVKALRVDVMQGAGQPGIPVRAGEVNGNLIQRTSDQRKFLQKFQFKNKTTELTVTLIWQPPMMKSRNVYSFTTWKTQKNSSDLSYWNANSLNQIKDTQKASPSISSQW